MKLDMFGKVDGVERALEYHLQRHNLRAGNLSNIETPGYRMRDLRFEESLESEMDGLEYQPSTPPSAKEASSISQLRPRHCPQTSMITT